ncbi:MFS transporter [Paraburkholderia phenoliruptrix]|uniref:Major facilitator superfamily protein n=2 Tax=Paraburkholderia phenoliruptrix TaxID=252970 RepID=K0E176_9BURK|nr:MFS transporter [Paraburkholderia phenoliruptrix]AFT89434.1 major facilitator superfamily protein [Paraburkholderia phenoliruptrix BR3459a]MDR6421909.1 sugar phosphate permease [Paraburkholderia phenoliruptrix]CAB4050623.1 Putative tartrate transporter [Paraburkholderia phenoliruptrix]
MSTTTPAIAESRLINRLALRLMPLLGLLYLVAYIDRSNISFAKLQMLGSLGLSEVAYGLGASLFFIGYLIFEVPSNVMLHKYGAPRWMARIMFTWGVVTILLAFTTNATMFYVLRFLLGASEAGLYPGVIYYLTLWFPARHRVRMLGYFTVGSSLGNMLGAPVCGWLLDKGGLAGLEGWQLVFIVTGLPSVLLTVVVLFLLPASPKEAKFLSADEKTWLTRTLDAERAQIKASVVTRDSLLSVLTEPRVIGMALYYMMLSISVYGVSYWLPTLVKGFGVSNTTNGLLNIIPWLMATIVLAWLPSRLRGVGNRALIAMLASALLGVMCFASAVFLPTNTLRFIALCFGAPCMYLLIPCFWTLPPKFLFGARAAAGIAAINSLGNIGGFIAQNLVPWVRQTTGSVKAPMLIPATCLLVFAVVTVFILRRDKSARVTQSAVAVTE